MFKHDPQRPGEFMKTEYDEFIRNNEKYEEKDDEYMM